MYDISITLYLCKESGRSNKAVGDRGEQGGVNGPCVNGCHQQDMHQQGCCQWNMGTCINGAHMDKAIVDGPHVNVALIVVLLLILIPLSLLLCLLVVVVVVVVVVVRVACS